MLTEQKSDKFCEYVTKTINQAIYSGADFYTLTNEGTLHYRAVDFKFSFMKLSDALCQSRHISDGGRHIGYSFAVNCPSFKGYIAIIFNQYKQLFKGRGDFLAIETQNLDELEIMLDLQQFSN